MKPSHRNERSGGVMVQFSNKYDLSSKPWRR